MNKFILILFCMHAFMSCTSSKYTQSAKEIDSIYVTLSYAVELEIGEGVAAEGDSNLYPLNYHLQRKGKLWNLSEISGMGIDFNSYSTSYGTISEEVSDELIQEMFSFHVQPEIVSLLESNPILLQDMYEDFFSQHKVEIVLASDKYSYTWKSSSETINFYLNYFRKLRKLAIERGKVAKIKYEH